MILNDALINSVSLNSEVCLSEGIGVGVHEVMAGAGEAESGPFVVEGASYHSRFQFSGAAITASLFVGASVHPFFESAGIIPSLSYGSGACRHPVARSEGLAGGASAAIGVSTHRRVTSAGAASTGDFCLGSSDHLIFVSAGMATSSDPSVQGASIFPSFVCRGVAGSDVAPDEYLQFVRDGIVAPTTDPAAFTIIQFERQ